MIGTKVTLSGGFHNSRPVNVVVKDGKLSVGQYKKLADHFCGIGGCVCGGVSRADVDGINRREFMGMVELAAYGAYAS